MIVVDASVLVDLVTAAPEADRLTLRLLHEDLHAPHLLDVEVVSALRALVLGGHLSLDRAHDALSDYDDLTITRWPAMDHQRQLMLDLRDNVTAYDAAYVALARDLGCPVLTRDERLARAPGPDTIEVI